MSLFKKDLSKEGILNLFLNQQYQKLGISIERVQNLNQQYKGIDLFLTEDNLVYKVDEKAQLHYLNSSLPTFALEINYLKNGNLTKGWLFDPAKSTEIYSFIFNIRLNGNKDKLERVEDILGCDIVMVKRVSLIIALSNLGLTEKVCEENSLVLRTNREQAKIVFNGEFNFQISNHLEEKPVNLIVRRSFLEKVGKVLLIKT